VNRNVTNHRFDDYSFGRDYENIWTRHHLTAVIYGHSPGEIACGTYLSGGMADVPTCEPDTITYASFLSAAKVDC
jgi:hypothetical protein